MLNGHNKSIFIIINHIIKQDGVKKLWT